MYYLYTICVFYTRFIWFLHVVVNTSCITNVYTRVCMIYTRLATAYIHTYDILQVMLTHDSGTVYTRFTIISALFSASLIHLQKATVFSKDKSLRRRHSWRLLLFTPKTICTFSNLLSWSPNWIASAIFLVAQLKLLCPISPFRGQNRSSHPLWKLYKFSTKSP